MDFAAVAGLVFILLAAGEIPLYNALTRGQPELQRSLVYRILLYGSSLTLALIGLALIVLI